MTKLTVHEALGLIQSKISVPKGQKNSFGNYNYRSCEDILAAVKPLLSEAGATLTLTDEVVLIGERYYVKAKATLSVADNGVWVEALARESEVKKGMDGAQITGSASSYARKYALCGLLAIDDTKDPDSMDNRNAPKQEKKCDTPFLNMKDAADGDYEVMIDIVPSKPRKHGKWTFYDYVVVHEGKRFKLALFDNEVQKDFPDGVKSASVGDRVVLTKKGSRRVFVNHGQGLTSEEASNV
jgi:hypothetical protein|tara:strand:- start:1349 stop:2068 length:720 start_codon:yes stop_codon:yes gene_type:complete